MAVQVTLTFNSYDEAIVALGKLVGVKTAAVPQVAGKERSEPSSTPAAPATRTRKPRSDAGQPRGSYRARNEQSATEGTTADPAGAGAPGEPQVPSSAPEPARNSETANAEAPSEPSAPATQAANPPAASAPSEKDAQAALEGLFNDKAKAGGNGAAIQAAKDLLSRYGVQKVRDLPAERRAEFIKECEAGGTV